jgi:hypothetical protein
MAAPDFSRFLQLIANCVVAKKPLFQRLRPGMLMQTRPNCFPSTAIRHNSSRHLPLLVPETTSLIPTPGGERFATLPRLSTQQEGSVCSHPTERVGQDAR